MSNLKKLFTREFIDKKNINLIIFTLLVPFFITVLKNNAKYLKVNDLPISIVNLLDLIDLKKYSLSDGLNIFAISISIRAIMFLLPIALITLVELSSKEFINTSLGRITASKGHKYADIWYFLINVFLNRNSQILVFLTMGLSQLSNSISNSFDNFYLSLVPNPDSVITSTFLMILVLLINDFCRFSEHWMEHHIPMIWDLHEFHHSATEMTIINEKRGSIFVGVITGFLLIPITVFTGLLLNACLLKGHMLPILIYIFDLVMQNFFAYLGHSSLPIIYPKPLSYIYMSPVLHWLHHSDKKEHWDCNLGEKYTFWDKLFNSYLDESHISEIEGFGVDGTDYNKYHPLYSYSILPIIKLIKRFRVFPSKLYKS